MTSVLYDRRRPFNVCQIRSHPTHECDDEPYMSVKTIKYPYIRYLTEEETEVKMPALVPIPSLSDRRETNISTSFMELFCKPRKGPIVELTLPETEELPLPVQLSPSVPSEDGTRKECPKIDAATQTNGHVETKTKRDCMSLVQCGLCLVGMIISVGYAVILNDTSSHWLGDFFPGC